MNSDNRLLSTQDILLKSKSSSYLNNAVENIWVSKVSRWNDPEWRLDNMTPGASNFVSCFLWNFAMPDASDFSEEKWKDIRNRWKMIVWSMFLDYRGGKNFKTGSAATISYGFRYFIIWMAKNSYEFFSELDQDSETSFLDELSSGEGREGNGDCDEFDFDEEKSYGTLKQRIQTWNYLWLQSDVLIEMGIEPLPGIPFDGRSVNSICGEIVTKVVGKIPALPDDVAGPIMEAAYTLLDKVAEDVLEIQSQYLSEYFKFDAFTRSTKQRRAKSAVSKKVVELHGKINKIFPTVYLSRLFNDGVVLDDENIVFSIRNFITDVRNACIIIIQSITGVRINEICGLRSGVDFVSGLPICVDHRKSKTGLNDLYYLHGFLAKTEEAPKKVEWLIGAVPCGSGIVPIPVLALLVLNRLFEPWRSMALEESVKQSLLVSFIVGNGLPKKSSMISKITGNLLLLGQKDFVRKFVDLTHMPDLSTQGENLIPYRESKGMCIKTHQWRKTFAIYMFRIDSRLLPAISQQFKHLSLAMTEQGYIGSDPSLIEIFDSVRLQKTVEFFLTASIGERKIYGRFADAIDQYLKDFFVNDTRDILARRNKVEQWVVKNDIRIWFADHGKCFIGINPNSARCHEIAGTSDWKRSEPNYATREAGLCLGCPCYAIDAEHKIFWKKRFYDNQSAFSDSIKLNDSHGFRVAKERAIQAAAVLKILKVDFSEMEASYEEKKFKGS